MNNLLATLIALIIVCGIFGLLPTWVFVTFVGIGIATCVVMRKTPTRKQALLSQRRFK